MSEEFLERLSQFTPDAGGLDRDALLFAAGHASARPNRVWKGLSAVLAGTQVLALALLWPQPHGVMSGNLGAIVQSSAPNRSTQHAVATGPTSTDIWSVRHDADDLLADEQRSEAVALIDSGPTLRAFGPFPSSVVN